jgi:hypothetical protein
MVAQASFENTIQATAEHTPSIDLEQLGVVVLKCINGGLGDYLRDIEEVRQERACNRPFGLENGERWSGSKLLVDFLDYTFSNSTTASTKLQKPVSIPATLSSALLTDDY